MRGDIVYSVYAMHEGRPEDVHFGTFRSVQEAEAAIEALRARPDGKSWEKRFHNKGFVIRSVAVETDFEVPPLPKPRDKYYVEVTKTSRPGTWEAIVVTVLRRDEGAGDPVEIGRYKRNYGMLQTFEPFRQHGRDYALISQDYTKTAVLDLSTGQVIAEEIETGFCPVGFYVPDWWDLYDGSVIPGSKSWTKDYEQPSGAYGFVWGCYWGDDSSWKVQYLDLSRISEGVLTRHERFGYVELATDGYQSPALSSQALAPGARSSPPRFIRLEHYEGKSQVTFAVEVAFDLHSGKCRDWKRQWLFGDEVKGGGDEKSPS